MVLHSCSFVKRKGQRKIQRLNLQSNRSMTHKPKRQLWPALVPGVIYNCRHSKSDRPIGTLLVEEIEQARKVWISSTQGESFPQEVALKSKQHVSSKSKLASLSNFLDEHGIVGAGGRIERADIPFCSRHPIVLSPYSAITRVLVINCHERLKHEGVENVGNELRQQYWYLRCRITVRN